MTEPEVRIKAIELAIQYFQIIPESIRLEIFTKHLNRIDLELAKKGDSQTLRNVEAFNIEVTANRFLHFINTRQKE